MDRKMEKRQMQLIERLIDENLRINHDGVMLFKSLNKLRVLEDVIFEPHDKVLLPLIILKNMREVLKSQKEEEEKQTAVQKTMMRVSGSFQLGGESGVSGSFPIKRRMQTSFTEVNIEEALQKQEEMSIKEAYQRLVRFRPENELKKCVRQYILDRLPSDFAKQLIDNDKTNDELGGDFEDPVQERTSNLEITRLIKSKRAEVLSEGLDDEGKKAGGFSIKKSGDEENWLKKEKNKEKIKKNERFGSEDLKLKSSEDTTKKDSASTGGDQQKQSKLVQLQSLKLQDKIDFVERPSERVIGTPVISGITNPFKKS